MASIWGLCETSATQCAYDEWKGQGSRGVIIDVTELCPAAPSDC
jgi:hypothetical protein